MKKFNKSKNYLLINATIYVFIIVLMLTTVTYAWFSLTNHNRATLVTQVSGVEAEYEFYIYNDPTHSGSQSYTLIDNTTNNPDELNKYLFITDPTNVTLIDEYSAPGERFSFAIKIANIGTTTGHVTLSLYNIESELYDRVENKIQTAYEYSVEKISYIADGVESEDQKDIQSLNYYADHFDYMSGLRYYLVDHIPLQYGEGTSVVIYFDLYFDPTVYGIDAYGQPYKNSNIFMGQKFTIYTIDMVLSA